MQNQQTMAYTKLAVDRIKCASAYIHAYNYLNLIFAVLLQSVYLQSTGCSFFLYNISRNRKDQKQTYLPGLRTIFPSGPTMTCGTAFSSSSLALRLSSSPGSTVALSSTAEAEVATESSLTSADDATVTAAERDGDLHVNKESYCAFSFFPGLAEPTVGQWQQAVVHDTSFMWICPYK